MCLPNQWQKEPTGLVMEEVVGTWRWHWIMPIVHCDHWHYQIWITGNKILWARQSLMNWDWSSLSSPHLVSPCFATGTGWWWKLCIWYHTGNGLFLHVFLSSYHHHFTHCLSNQKTAIVKKANVSSTLVNFFCEIKLERSYLHYCWFSIPTECITVVNFSKKKKCNFYSPKSNSFRIFTA